ncbi:MAG: 50S ribosomal protein L22 [Bacteroidota bacterium]|jgi:large subunit ribosomal protein L22
MGKRKRLAAEARKEANKSIYVAKLNSCPTSPRKMRQVADLVRGIEAYKALNILKFNTREASGRLEKVLKSAIANYEAKTGVSAEENTLFVTSVKVDSALMAKRLRTAPQGRGYRIRKRSNHVTLEVGTVAPESKKAQRKASAIIKEDNKN